tara:strand:- start:2197 stop:2361 length:165 start_codon:yes stop_codon:yes gene_type:complete
MKKRDIDTLKRAALILQSIPELEYDAMVDDGCEPMTAEHNLDIIIVNRETEKGA